jgi:hypothetical protein
MMDSTVILFSSLVCRMLLVAFGGGILVIARRAATEGGIASGECTPLRWRDVEFCFLSS